jgi:predicted nucleic acid-binding protein
MIHSVQFTCVLDTNVIYPIDIRDLLFWFAHYELYTPKWSNHIFDEWKDVMIRKGILLEDANKRINKAQLAFPDALVENYEPLIDGLELPDPKDRHVLAAAIKTNANVIQIISRTFLKNTCQLLASKQKVLMISLLT